MKSSNQKNNIFDESKSILGISSWGVSDFKKRHSTLSFAIAVIITTAIFSEEYRAMFSTTIKYSADYIFFPLGTMFLWHVIKEKSWRLKSNRESFMKVGAYIDSIVPVSLVLYVTGLILLGISYIPASYICQTFLEKYVPGPIAFEFIWKILIFTISFTFALIFLKFATKKYEKICQAIINRDFLEASLELKGSENHDDEICRRTV